MVPPHRLREFRVQPEAECVESEIHLTTPFARAETPAGLSAVRRFPRSVQLPCCTGRHLGRQRRVRCGGNHARHRPSHRVSLVHDRRKGADASALRHAGLQTQPVVGSLLGANVVGTVPHDASVAGGRMQTIKSLAFIPNSRAISGSGTKLETYTSSLIPG